jgi:O-antigen/teichoic acid export membrane protein
MNFSHIFRQSFIYLIGDAARRLAAVIMVPLYTHYLSPSEYGTLEVIDLAVLVTSVMFGVVGVTESMVRIYHRRSEEARNTVVSTAVWAAGLVSVLATLLAVLFASDLSTLLFKNDRFALLLRGAFLTMAFSAMLEVGLGYQRLMKRAGWFVVLSLGQLLLNIGLNVWLIAFARMGVSGFVLGRLGSAVAGALIVLFLVFREVGTRFDMAALRDMTKFGSPLILSGAAMFIIHFGDRFFLSRYTTLADLGVYALAYKIGFLVTYFVGEPFGRVWGVSLYSYVSNPGWKNEFARVFRYLVFALFLAGVVLTVFSKQIFTLIANPSYIQGAQYVPILAFAYVFREAGDFYRNILFINSRTPLFSGLAVGCALLNTVLNILLVPTSGAMGAAWTTLATWLVYMTVCWAAAWREHGIPYAVRSFVLLVTLCTPVFLLNAHLRPSSFFLECALNLGLIILFVTLSAYAYFPRNDRDSIRRFLAARRLVGAQP